MNVNGSMHFANFVYWLSGFVVFSFFYVKIKTSFECRESERTFKKVFHPGGVPTKPNSFFLYETYVSHNTNIYVCFL